MRKAKAEMKAPPDPTLLAPDTVLAIMKTAFANYLPYVLKAAISAMKSDDVKARVMFGIEWGRDKADPEYPGSDGRRGPQIDDPMILLIEIPVIDDYDDEPSEWRFSLSDAVDSLIDLYMYRDTKKIDGFDAIRVAMVRDALRALADRIDGHLQP